MPRLPALRLPALCLLPLLAACDGTDWSNHSGIVGVSNASNGQPMPTTSYPRGASSYGEPPNAMAFPKLGNR